MKKNNSAARQYFQAFYRGNRLLFALTLLFTILIAPANLIGSWMLGETLDLIAAADLGRLGWMVGFTLLFIPVSAAVGTFYHWVKGRYIHRALAQYKDLAFRRLSEKSISAFAQENTGRYLSVLTNDVGSIEENYLNRSFLLIYHCLTFLGSLVMMFWYSWPLALATIALSLLPVAASVLMGGELARRETAVSDQNERFVSQLKDLLGGFSVIKSRRPTLFSRR